MNKTNTALLKKMDIVAYILSVVVLALVGYMRGAPKLDLGVDFSFLPPVHALVNTLCAVFLFLAVYQVRKGNVEQHKKFIFGAMVCSALFLLSYVLYHFTTEETRYCNEGVIRYVYFFFLITHIVLAGISLPFILLTFNRGFTMAVDKHKKMARWVYPVWLYVAVTGPIVYLMLYPCYS